MLYKKRFFLFFHNLLILVFVFSCKIFANPQDPKIVSGDVIIDQFDKDSLNVLASDKSIINWKSFSIDANEITQFIQPGSDACVLNRVIGHDLSSILGTIDANGKVFLINQNGILISENAFINTSSFLASILDVLDEEFLNAKDLIFKGLSKEAIINYGTIQTQDGNITLLGNIVENHGLLDASNGNVTIAASDEILLQMDEDHIGVIRLKNDKTTDAKIYNSGNILAIQADLISGGNPYDYAIKNSGSITAFGIEEKDGHVFLIADEGKNIVTGSIAAKNENNTGGNIQILGDKVAIFEEAIIDASADFEAGDILIGGDFQGKNPDIKNANYTYVGKDVTINAYGETFGKGGKVIVWSDENTHFYGTINAQGGRDSGDGGFVEISSHKNLDYKGFVSTNAPNGKTGELLFDPLDLIVNAVASTNVANLPAPFSITFPTASPANLDVADLVASLGVNNVTLRTSASADPESGHLTISTPIVGWASANNLTLSTNVSGVTSGEVRIFNTITCTGSGSLIVYSGSDFFLNSTITLATGNALIQTPNGDVTITSGSSSCGIITTGNIEFSDIGGDILIRGATLGFFPVPCLVSGNIITIKDVTGDVTILGFGGAIGNPGTVDVTSTTRTEISNIGGNLRVEGGFQFGAWGRLRSDANMSITNIRGDIILQGGSFPNCDALINSDGIMNITNIRGDINLNPTPTVRGAEIFSDGDMLIQTPGSFIFNENGLIQIDNPAPGINLTLIAGKDFSTENITTPAAIIWNRSTTGQITIVVDNDNPTFPNVGTGAFLLGPNADIRPGSSTAPLRIFTSRRMYNSIEGTLRSLAFIPGEEFVNTATEEWGVYYPGGFSGDPYTIFYKDGTALFDVVKDIVFIASAEMLARELHPYNEYISRYLDFDIRYQDKDIKKIAKTLTSYDVFNKFYYFIRQKQNPINYIQAPKSL